MQKLFESAYVPGLYWDGKGEERLDDVLDLLGDERARGIVPRQDRGAQGTTGGLAIYCVHNWPAWIESPWGEWWCWNWESCGAWGPMDTLKRFRQTLDVVPELSRETQPDLQVWALYSVGGLVLPTYRRSKMLEPMEDWVRMCGEYNPPILVPEFWRKAVIV